VFPHRCALVTFVGLSVTDPCDPVSVDCHEVTAVGKPRPLLAVAAGLFLGRTRARLRGGTPAGGRLGAITSLPRLPQMLLSPKQPVLGPMPTA